MGEQVAEELPVLGLGIGIGIGLGLGLGSGSGLVLEHSVGPREVGELVWVELAQPRRRLVGLGLGLGLELWLGLGVRG